MRILVAAALTLATSVAVAHGPTRQKVVESPLNDPPADKNDEAAIKAVTDIYRSGLAHLKELLQK